MPTIRKKATKAGIPFYEIAVSRGRNKSRLTTRWYPPEGWSQRAIDRELSKVAAEFERRCHAGEIISRAEQHERDQEAAREAAKVQTVQQYGDLVFMPSKSVTMSENSRSSFQGNLNRWIYPAIGAQKMPDVTAADISALLLSIQAQGKAHATVIKVYTILNGLFKMAYLADIIPRNPMDKVERPRPRKDEAQDVAVQANTVEEVRGILAALEREPLEWGALVRLLIDTGIRRGECCGLQWADVDFRSNTVTICRNLCYTPQKGVYVDTPKNGKARVIDVDPEIMDLLRALRTQQAAHAISAYGIYTGREPGPYAPTEPHTVSETLFQPV